ncbi:MAG: EF-hand domain-containing protein [candidate division Zixibacteria bacterium]|nr:EF-hand domain-containing protein [candidate division Zixibacteria bacterium]
MMGINLFSSSFYTFYMNNVMDKMANQVFQRNDINKDDVITKDEFNGTKDAFNLMDTDSDGEIDITDVKDAFGLNPTSTSQSNILKDMLRNSFLRQIHQKDKDYDNTLSLEEYKGKEEDFKRVDTNKNKEITADEMLQDYLAQNPDIARLISQMDTMNMLLDALTNMGKTDSHSYF